jgi:hypothetical protein
MEPKGFHMSDLAALLVTDRGQGLGKDVLVPGKAGPVRALVDVYSPHDVRQLLNAISAQRSIHHANP